MYLVLFSSFPLQQLLVGYRIEIGIFYISDAKNKKETSVKHLNIPFKGK